MNDLFRVLQVLKKNKGTRFVMVTVVAVEGSAYRHEGAKMLIDAQGKMYGMISGGCLEEDLVHYAMEVFQGSKPKLITYDLSSENDLTWGQGAGCNGVIYVYLEETGWNSFWEGIDRKLVSGHRVASLKYIDEEKSHEKIIFDFEDEDVGKSLVPYVESGIANDKKAQMITMRNKRKTLLELYKPKERLFIFGAGPDTEPLVKAASILDFFITLIDPRSERFDWVDFSLADQRIIEFPHLYLQQNELPADSFVLIMTHHFQWDQSALKYLINHPPRYLGVLGPKKRTARLLYPNPIPTWIHSPVGMDIQAEGPEEIAISICAELIKNRNLS